MNATWVRSALAGALGIGFTIAIAVSPAAVLHHRVPVLQTVVWMAVVLGTLVALLAYGRFRRSGTRGDLSLALAVALLAWVHTLFGTIPDMISPKSVGNGISERVEFWGALVTTLVAAWLVMMAASRRPLRPAASRRGRLWQPVLLAPVGLGLAAITLLSWLAPIGSSGWVSLPLWPSMVLRSAGAALFFAAFLRLSRRAEGPVGDRFLGWIAAGCVFAGLALVNYAPVPHSHRGWLWPGDLLRAAAVATWVMGAVAEILSYWSKIAESTRRETRRSVALDLHDGLAQELALLTMYTYAPSSERAQVQWAQQLQVTAERALAEARRAITALAADEPIPFAADLEWTAESISGSNVAVRVDVGTNTAAMDPLQRETLVRIVREAVTNAVRHGSARHVDILFELGASPALRVVDDGVGFDPSYADTATRFGLASMRERAETLGASLAVRSAPGEGTMVEVLWP